MATQPVPVTTLGHVTKGELRIDDVSFGFINDFKQIYDTALEQILKGHARPQKT